MGALAVAGYVIGHGSGLGRFVGLQGAGCLVGLIGTAFLLGVPGGAPAAPTAAPRPHGAEMRDALRDRNFRRFLFGTAGLSIGGGMVTAFMPLLLVEKVGIQPGTVIWIDTAAMIGGIVVSLPCGWIADRFGSRTVLMPGLTLGLTLSCFWLAVLALGKASLLGLPALALLGLLTGIASNAVAIGSGRLLLAGVVPPTKSVAYTAIYYAWVGLMSGLAPLLAGGILTAVAAAGRSRTGMQVDSYTVLFLLSLIPGVLGWLYFAATRPDGAFRTRDLFKGQPWM